MTEKEIIQYLQKEFPTKGGIGDDCAFLPIPQACELAIGTDTLVENTHFSFDYFTPEDIAHKLFHVNASDLLTKGAIPEFVFLNISCTSSFSNNGLRMFLFELTNLLKSKNISLLGGDTTLSETCVFTLTMMGSTKYKVMRSSSTIKKDDLLIMNKPIGGSLLAYEKLINKKEISDTLKCYHTRPNADFTAPQWLERLQAKASIDLSDSLYDSLEILSNSNQCGFQLQNETIPLIEELQYIDQELQLSYGLCSAEDLAILAIIDSSQKKNAIEMGQHIIGSVITKQEIEIYSQHKKIQTNKIKKLLEKHSYRHF